MEVTDALLEKAKTDPGALNSVLEASIGTIKKAASAYAGAPIPGAAIYGEGLRLAVNAIRGWDPSKGAAWTTHLTAHLRRLNRYVESNKRVDRVPENQYLRLTKYRAAKSLLEQRNGGREPTSVELADYLGWPVNHVERIEKVNSQRSLAGSGIEGAQRMSTADAMAKEKAELLYYGWPQEKQLVYDYLLGQHGKPRTGSVDVIAKKINKSPTSVYRIRNALANELK